MAHGDGALAEQLLAEVRQRDPIHDIATLEAQAAWLRGDMPAAQAALRQALAQANPGERGLIRADLERLFALHPSVPGQDELRGLFSS